MRIQPLANCERRFILNSFLENLRVDGRQCEEYRRVKLFVGSEPGSCLATFGNTKVFSQVSCEVRPPKTGRPNEGHVHVNVEMSPMGAPNHEPGRLGSKGLEVTRMLERLLCDSGCIDKESLCLKAGVQAWEIRVDVHVVDHDGGLLDCASLSAITAVAHFRRPDCSLVGETVIIHSPDERDLVPLNLYHMPVCVTFGLTENGSSTVVDPTEREELCLEGTIVVGANKRQEVCALHCSGSVVVKKQHVLKCVAKAIQRAADLNELIRSVIVDDREKRAKGHQRGFTDLISLELLTGNECEPNELIAPAVAACSIDALRHQMDVDENPSANITVRNSAVHLGAAHARPMMSERIDDDDDDDDELVAQIAADVAHQSLADSDGSKRRRIEPMQAAADDVNSLLDDIEDDVVMLNPQDLGYEKKTPVLVDLVDDDDEDADVNLTAALKPKGKKKKKVR